ncbi:uncharacterized protein LOC113278984 [Papaver somniferum]|uniref:uncharacterized protein LOC113278984 n=1 Tax=Papaver somniferum TaxID=3469 RepID=UPI000E702F5C|nr:uncharacterized protein LOC113278984 [Papaver somniferum]
MALVQKYGKMDLFITMTCNPNWEEIRRKLKEGKQAHDRPDLTTRVFHSKFEELKADLFTKGVLGKVVAYIHVIEFQKRGLPHAHILIILHEKDKLRTPDDYDRVVRAEIPDDKVEPELYASVLKHMIHVPCALSADCVCKKDGKCKKRFPKKFAAETLEGQDLYPVYRRRDDGREITLANGKVMNNSWFVPYNSWLLKKYDYHINVEICSSVQSVKYLYKYVWKGVDRVSMEVSNEKEAEYEIKQFVDARWICPQEDLWWIYKYQKNKIYPLVLSLQVHLKDRQKILLPEGSTVRDVMRREKASHTQLTEFFKKNQEDEFARTLLYKQFPEHYMWDKPLKQWKRRQRDNKVISRVNIFSTRSENYHLRLILKNIRGTTSFENLLKVGDNMFSTYKEATQHLCLLESDTPIRDTLLEDVQVDMPWSLRRLFCMLLDLCNPTGVREFWDEFFPYMIEDHCRFNTETWAINLLLREVRVVNYVMIGEKSIFFIDGPGGSGKTFLYRAILDKLRSERRIAIATATSGIAATMIPGGMTTHSRFKIPVPAYATSTCNIGAEDPSADFIRKVDLITWDEATMANRYAFEALDTTLRDFTKVDLPFGGKILLLGGDFRQVLHVVEHGTRAQTISACLINAKFGKDVKVIRSIENMRSRLDPSFLEFLLRIGDGTEPYVVDDMVKLPDDIVMKWEGEQSVEKLIDEVFPELEKNASDKSYMSQRALITPKNDIVEKLNQKVINIFPGDEIVYHSFDMAKDDPNNLWTEDFLNTISPGGFPPHRLILKIGAPIILLRNLDPSYGLCSDTRLLCRGLYRNFIDAEIVTGSCSGLRVLIPRIPMEPPKEHLCAYQILSFKFVRKQFPVRAGFALTINKAQGQTIPHVGIYLPEPVFSHGQLYVALSRGVSRTTTKVLVKNGVLPDVSGTCTKNVVFQDVLRSSDIVE